MRRCTQIKCGYYLTGGCRNCSQCNAEPYNINEECSHCVSCEGEEGSLRWEDDCNKQKEEQLVRVM